MFIKLESSTDKKGRYNIKETVEDSYVMPFKVFKILLKNQHKLLCRP